MEYNPQHSQKHLHEKFKARIREDRHEERVAKAKRIVDLIKSKPEVFNATSNPRVEILKPAKFYSRDTVHRQFGINGRMYQKAVIGEHKPGLFLSKPFTAVVSKDVYGAANYKEYQKHRLTDLVVVDDARIWTVTSDEIYPNMGEPRDYSPSMRPEFFNPLSCQVIGAHALDLSKVNIVLLDVMSNTIEHHISLRT